MRRPTILEGILIQSHSIVSLYKGFVRKHMKAQANLMNRRWQAKLRSRHVRTPSLGAPPRLTTRGFIVLNPPTYPNFLRFLRLLKIPLLKTEMTFSVSRDRGVFEWAGDGPAALFCQLTNL